MEFTSKKKEPVVQQPKEFWRVGEWFTDIDASKLELLRKFNDELKKFNNALNLVSAKTLPLSDIIHFADCISASRLMYNDCKPKQIVDFGSGNGFPGVVFAILYPQVTVTIIDRDARKIEFLGHVVKTLSLNNINCQVNSLESIPQGSLECVVTRGFAPISKAILALRKPFKKGGILYMLKGEEWATEVANIPSQLCTFWTPHLEGEYKLPLGEVKFAVVKLLKVNE